MKNFNDIGFIDRLSTSAQARAKQLERAHAQARTSQAGAGERDVANRARATLREERAIARMVAVSELRSRRLAEDAARAQAAAAREKDLADAAAHDRALQDEQKAARDARYAARKARGRK
jgi:hypothetical protein